MHQFIKKLIAITTLVSATNTYAIPLVEADAFAAGDNKAALDTTSGLVWMDFGVNTSWTSGVSFYKITSELDTTYAGWRLPTETEVRNLWNNLFGNLSITADHFAPPVYPTEQYSLFDWDNKEIDAFQEISNVFGYFEADYAVNRTGEEGMGDEFLAKSSISYFLTDSGHLASWQMWTPVSGVHMSGAHLDFSEDESAPEWIFGALLVKKTEVPEPSSIALLMMGLLGLGWRYRFKK